MLFKSGDQKLADRKCPLCREKIPPTKEMLARLNFMREDKIEREAKGDIFSKEYTMTKDIVKEMELEIGDTTETIDYSDKKHMVLPEHIFKAAMLNDIQTVLDWLGLPVDRERLNAKCVR